MIRTIAIAAILMTGGVLLSNYYVGYPRAGKQYISKHREQRKSLRTGSGYYGTYGMRPTSGSFRGGGK